MEKTFNMGVGMVAVLPPDDVDRALAMLTARHVPSWVLGSVRRAAEAPPAAAAPGSRVLLMGDHPRFSALAARRAIDPAATAVLMAA